MALRGDRVDGLLVDKLLENFGIDCFSTHQIGLCLKLRENETCTIEQVYDFEFLRSGFLDQAFQPFYFGGKAVR